MASRTTGQYCGRRFHAMASSCSLIREQVEVTTESKAVHRVAVTIKSGGAVSEDCLRQLAEELGEEWNNLAKQLGINSIRLSAILRENQLESQPEKEAKFDMLMTWRKKVPRSMDSVSNNCLTSEMMNLFCKPFTFCENTWVICFKNYYIPA